MVNQIYSNGLISPRNQNALTPEQKKLKQTCNEFEAMMVRQMLDSMEGSTKMFGEGFGGDFYQGMFLDAIAKQISEKGMGLSKMMYEQLNKTNGGK